MSYDHYRSEHDAKHRHAFCLSEKDVSDVRRRALMAFTQRIPKQQRWGHVAPVPAEWTVGRYSLLEDQVDDDSEEGEPLSHPQGYIDIKLEDESEKEEKGDPVASAAPPVSVASGQPSPAVAPPPIAPPAVVYAAPLASGQPPPPAAPPPVAPRFCTSGCFSCPAPCIGAAASTSGASTSCHASGCFSCLAPCIGAAASTSGAFTGCHASGCFSCPSACIGAAASTSGASTGCYASGWFSCPASGCFSSPGAGFRTRHRRRRLLRRCSNKILRSSGKREEAVMTLVRWLNECMLAHEAWAELIMKFLTTLVGHCQPELPEWNLKQFGLLVLFAWQRCRHAVGCAVGQTWT